MNPLKQLLDHQQSFWLDYIRRSLIASGELNRLIEEDGLRGMTSNPAIFEQAIAGTDEYDDMLRDILAQNPYLEPVELFEELAITEIRNACDVLRGIYDASDGLDGYVSLEVAPTLARETAGTIDEARRLWTAVDRPNVMIKVPATPEGIPAIETLLGEGININVTLMFSMDHYEAVAYAYIRGLEGALKHGHDLSKIASVASFFVSRVDSKIDARLDAIGTPEALALKGKIAIANSKVTYQRYKEIFHGDDFAHLRAEGAMPQRVLWASTSTKDPDYPDTLYVDELIGPETVNTMPPQTVDAFRDHGAIRGNTVEADLEDAEAQLAKLAELGIDLDQATEELQDEGVDKFEKPFASLLETLEKERNRLAGELANGMTLSLGNATDAVEQRLGLWEQSEFAQRIWDKDPTLWSAEFQKELGDRLGWLDLPGSMLLPARDLKAFALATKDEYDHVVVLGMGGSSLAPDVFRQAFGGSEGYPSLLMLDSTHPQAVQDVAAQIKLNRTLFIVASKSGTTAETLSFYRYFYDQLKTLTETPGDHFVAITDPGTKLEFMAYDRDFLQLFSAPPEVGGRYSALTVFGLVPAACTGINVSKLLDRAWLIAEQTMEDTVAADNPALQLGAALGELARSGRDKVTFAASPSLASFPIWLEQLIAESTGKSDTGIVPVADEALAAPDAYGKDRFFVYFYLDGDEDADQQAKLDALEEAGHPIARIHLRDLFDLGREMFRWEYAVAAASEALGIHPFNQPNVELAKNLAREAMKNVGGDGASPGVDEVSADNGALAQALQGWLEQTADGDYLALHAYVPPSDEMTETLQQLRHALRDQTRLATTLGYGPRFLHSTGQLHKGGANTIHVLQLVDTSGTDIAVPETDFTFRQLINAQAQGDYQALKQRERNVLRINLGNDPAAGLKRLVEAMAATA